jgi:bacterioferritin-associated ferredoxin
MDIDTVLIAIRIATYGHSMDIDSQCPKCQHENNFELDLRTVMGQISSPDYAKTVKHGDIEIFFRPLDYYHMNQNNLAQFEDQKMIQNIEAAVELPAEERMTRLGEVLKKITGVTIHALAASISAVRTPTAVVTETEHIAEWLANSDRTVFAQVRDHIIEEKQVSEIKPLKITCGACSHQYEQMFTLDMSNFFVDAS